MLSSSERQSLERHIENGLILVHGSKQRGLETLKAFPSSTLALDASSEKITQAPQIYASQSIDVAAFCATTWSRDGWSGWLTYDARLHEFFAAPYVLKEARFAIGALYVVRRSRFTPSGAMPGEFVSSEDVPVEEEFSVNFDDIRQYVYRSAHMGHNRERALRPGREAEPLDIEKLQQLDPAKDPRQTMLMDQADNWHEHFKAFS